MCGIISLDNQIKFGVQAGSILLLLRENNNPFILFLERQFVTVKQHRL